MNRSEAPLGVPAKTPAPHPAIRLATLDFLRGVAALMVVANHVRGVWQVGGRVMLGSGHAGFGDYVGIAFLQFTSFGSESVILFFVLSGFAMAHSLRFGQNIGRFYVKRIIRIWPPYLAALLFAALLSLAAGAPVFSPASLLAAAFYINAATFYTPQFWSLPFEVAFYAICPFILVSTRSVVLTFALSTIFLIVTIAAMGPLLNPYPYFLLNFLGNEMFFFSCGTIAYHFIDRVPVIVGWRLIIALAGLACATWLAKIHFFNTPNAVSNLFVIVASVIAIRNVPDWLSSTKWLNYGHCSYSIYLFHYVIIVVMSIGFLHYTGTDPRNIKSYVAWVPIFPIVLLPCIALYYVIERPTNIFLAQYRSKAPSPSIE